MKRLDDSETHADTRCETSSVRHSSTHTHSVVRRMAQQQQMHTARLFTWVSPPLSHRLSHPYSPNLTNDDDKSIQLAALTDTLR